MSNRFPKRQKLALLLLSFLVGTCSYFAAYAYFSKDMTTWQKNQPIDFDAQTGATKTKAHINALSVGGLAFCATVITITTAVKLYRLK